MRIALEIDLEVAEDIGHVSGCWMENGRLVIQFQPGTASRPLPTTGTELRMMRLARRVTVVEMARHVDVSRQYLSKVELSTHPTREAVSLYMAALEASQPR